MPPSDAPRVFVVGSINLDLVATTQRHPTPGETVLGDDFDFNLDGLAHYGLLPDLIQDAKNVGLSDKELTPFKTEFDVTSTLRGMRHEVVPLGVEPTWIWAASC